MSKEKEAKRDFSNSPARCSSPPPVFALTDAWCWPILIHQTMYPIRRYCHICSDRGLDFITCKHHGLWPKCPEGSHTSSTFTSSITWKSTVEPSETSAALTDDTACNDTIAPAFIVTCSWANVINGITPITNANNNFFMFSSA